MKRSIVCTFALAIMCVTKSALANDNYQVILEPRWQPFEQSPLANNDEWILIGSMTFKKKVKDTVHLTGITLKRNGTKISKLHGSLYRKDPAQEFRPLEENLVCDGTWNELQQTLKLKFNESQSLGPTNIFYLVLTVPKESTASLKTGNFELVENCLPEPFKPNKADHKLLLSLDALGAEIESK